MKYVVLLIDMQAKNKYIEDYDNMVMITSLLGQGYLIWIGNVTKSTCKWF